MCGSCNGGCCWVQPKRTKFQQPSSSIHCERESTTCGHRSPYFYPRTFIQAGLKVEAPGGVEPPTNGLGNRCSIHLSYGARIQNERRQVCSREMKAGAIPLVAALAIHFNKGRQPSSLFQSAHERAVGIVLPPGFSNYASNGTGRGFCFKWH